MLVKRPKSRTKSEPKPEHRVLAEQRFQEVRRNGRPPGARNKLSEGFIGDLHDIWTMHGPAILQRMLVDDPARLAELVARLIPKEFQVSVHQETAIPAQDQALLVDLLRTIKGAVPADASTTPVLEFISEVLRIEYAKQVESTD
jgi:hypothetical protein